jgi:predicted secreted protein
MSKAYELIALAAVSAILALAAGQAGVGAAQAPAQLEVCAEGCSYGDSQAAVNDALPGDIIQVYLPECLGGLIVEKPLTIIGGYSGWSKPLVDGKVGSSIILKANGTTLRGFELRGPGIGESGGSALDIRSSSNSIYLNDISGKSAVVVSASGQNTWNMSKPEGYQYNSNVFMGLLGNYWTEYNGTDKDHNGIGDEPMIINSENIDYCPLMQPSENYRPSDDRDSKEEIIRVKEGEPFSIKLKSNPTAGFKWFADYEFAYLRLDNQSYERLTDQVGSAGASVFTFTPLKAGTTKAQFVYRRPWENIATGTRAFRVIISP